MIKHILHFAHAQIRNFINNTARPWGVTYAQRKHVKLFPECAACGATKWVQGHHVKPYHKYPEHAADPNNFVSLCEHFGGHECHLHLGHAGSFLFYNPHVLHDAEDFKRAKTDYERSQIVDRAFRSRLPDAT